MPHIQFSEFVVLPSMGNENHIGVDLYTACLSFADRHECKLPAGQTPIPHSFSFGRFAEATAVAAQRNGVVVGEVVEVEGGWNPGGVSAERIQIPSCPAVVS